MKLQGRLANVSHKNYHYVFFITKRLSRWLYSIFLSTTAFDNYYATAMNYYCVTTNLRWTRLILTDNVITNYYSSYSLYLQFAITSTGYIEFKTAVQWYVLIFLLIADLNIHTFLKIQTNWSISLAEKWNVYINYKHQHLGCTNYIVIWIIVSW